MNPEMTKIYEDKLNDVREVVKATKTLIESEDYNIRLEAIDLFIQLSELELALVQFLSEEPESQADEERNPLVRRLRFAT